MYKKITTLILLVALAQTAFAQMAVGGKIVYIGGKAGVNVTTVGQRPGYIFGSFGMTKDKKEEAEGAIRSEIGGRLKIGTQAGIIFDFPATDKLSIQPGIVFFQYGCKMKADISTPIPDTTPAQKETTDMKASVTLNYVQIPLTFQLKKERIRTTRLIQISPYIGIGLGGKIKEKYFDGGKMIYTGGWQIPMGADSELYDYSNIDYGVGIGFGYQFRSVQAVLSYNAGLKNINMNYSAFSPRVYNSGVALTLTFL